MRATFAYTTARILLFVAATMVSANIIVDFVYGWIDPRMRTAPR